MVQNQVKWSALAVGVKPAGNTGAYTIVHGATSMGITTTFNLTQVFELGQSEIYENIEDVPDIEITLERYLDGYPLFYHLMTQGAPQGTLIGRTNQRSIVAMSIFSDTSDSASGIPLSIVEMSGLFVSNLNYSFTVDNPFTESVTAVGNNKIWSSGILDYGSKYGQTFSGILFDNTDFPIAAGGSGGVNRREDFQLEPTADSTRLPTDIPGVSSSGTVNTVAGNKDVHVQSVTASVDLGRTPINELGRKGPYFRGLDLPVQTTCEISFISLSGDMINAEEEEENLTDHHIRIVTLEGTSIDLGQRNKLQSTSMTGGSTGGEDQIITNTYTSFNTFTVSHPADPG